MTRRPAPLLPRVRPIFWPRFWRDDSGAILVIYAMGLVAVLGLVALVFDVGRVHVSQGELQGYADQTALAAAAELDGRPDAITRATAAAAVITDTVSFGADTSLSGAADYTLTFLDGLPANDTAGTGGFATTDPEDAYLARVVVTPRGFDLPFLGAVRALAGTQTQNRTATVSAEAIAGMTQEACDITPLMFCQPPGWSASDPGTIGDMIWLRAGGQGAAWGPGNFGFLDTSAAAIGSTCASLSGAKLVACLIGAEDNVTQCYSQRGVDTEPGQKSGLSAAAFNTRFDVFEGVMNQFRNDPAYTVAPNIVSGRRPKSNGGGGGGGGNCAWEPSADTIPFPNDTCIGSTCGRFGDGVWDYATYMATNHPTDAAAIAALIPAEWTGTRYGVYLAEIAFYNANGYILTGLEETGRPECSPNVSTDPRRRVLIAAAVDCAATPVNGSTTGVPVEEWVEIFMTRPVGATGGGFDIFVEVIGSAGLAGSGGSGTGGVFRDVVQLYR